MLSLLRIILMFASAFAPIPHHSHFAAPTGSPRGDGSILHPWDLATALAPGSRVPPGDTIWLRGGTYRGAFRSGVAGTAGAPVVVRGYPGERAIVDGGTSKSSTLYVTGDNSVFWGFELTNSSVTRTTPLASEEVRPNVVVNDASHTKYINLIVHDGGVAFYNEPATMDVEVAGWIIYNNGWQGPDRGHGHGLYLKSLVGPLVARDNVIFNQFGYGVHAYTNKGTGKLINIRIEGNVAFNSGLLASKPKSAPNILLGGADYATADVVRDNFTYFAADRTTADANMKIGFGTTQNGDVQVTGNYVAGGDPVLEFGSWSAARVANNTFLGAAASLIRRTSANSGAAVLQIFRDNLEARVPGESKIVVRPNPYERGRAHLIVYNWGRQDTANVDLTDVLEPGDHYEIHNVQDLFGAAVASGTFDGTAVKVPLQGVTPPVPVGMTTSPAPRTGPLFDVFLVQRTTH
ncbi:MAG: hypothetical protein ABR537_03425 [Gemmatimonadales bacterium]